MRLSTGALFVLTGGACSLAACSLETAGPKVVQCTVVSNIALGDTVLDSITASSCRLSDNSYANYYKFVVADSQAQVLATLSSPTGLAYLHVSDTTAFLLANSSISQTVDTSAVLRLFLRQGTYYLGVNSYGAPSGRFRMAFTRDSTPLRGCTAEWITPAIATSQTLTAADCTGGPAGLRYYTHVYYLVARASTLLSMTEHSTAFSPQLLVFSYVGRNTVSVSSLDSTGTNGNVVYIPANDDLLLLFVGSSDTLQTGAYSLKVK